LCHGDKVVMKHSGNLALQETNRALQLADKGRRKDAYAIYTQLAGRVPDDLETKGQFAKLCLALGNVDYAIEILKDLTTDYPDNAFYIGMLGNAYIRVGQLLEAESAFKRSLELEPNLWMAHADLGLVYTKLEQYDKGIQHLEKAISLKPSHAQSHANLVVCLISTDQHKEAMACAKKAVRLDPKNPHLYDSIGCALAEMGQLSEAVPYFEKAMALDNTLGTTFLNYSYIKKFSEKDKPFIDKVEEQLKTGLPAKQRANFHFTLGKAYNDCREYDKAFTHYRQANMLAKTQRPEPLDYKHYLKLQKKVFTKECLNTAQEIGNSSNIPVFIVGMPRSGTSLIEQIMSRHSSISGAGELDTIHEIADQVGVVQDHKNYVDDWLKHLNKTDLTNDADKYLKVLQKDNQDSPHITDKLPENYLYLGYIHLLFPNAKIIHATRNPLDTCLSCYFQPFAQIHWSYDLKWIEQRYRFYRQVMEYWKSVLPADSIMEVSYESLIENQEAESRRLIAHCGLDWEEGCLDHNNDKRVVATASLWQVRQPIYKSSVKRWMNYTPHIAELAKGLGQYLDSEDIKLLKQSGIKVKAKSWWR
jgi:tetratricopeptide (TPR) repeat protein